MASTATVFKSSLNQTLHFITEIKLQEVETQRREYQERAQSLRDAIRDKTDILEKVEILAKAIKNFRGPASLDHSEQVGGKLHLGDLTFWLQQARHDPGFRIEIAEDWLHTLEEYIHNRSLRFDAAKLFGELFNEWMASGDSSTVAYQGTSATAEVGDASEDNTNAKTGSEFIEVGRKEMYEQKEKLESLIFEDYPGDTEKLETYLETLFGSEEAKQSLEDLRGCVKRIGYSFTHRRSRLTIYDVKNAITGLLASSLMDEEKRSTLKTIMGNKIILEEVVSVLTMRIAKFSSWSWPKEGLLIEFRRHLNGKYKAFTDPEIIDALLLQHIGISWQVKLKSALRSIIFKGDAWNRKGTVGVESTPAAEQRRKDQIPGNGAESPIDTVRNAIQGARFFVSQLHDNKSKPNIYDDLVDANNKNDKDNVADWDSADTEKDAGEAASPGDIKRKLLHIMTTECYLSKALHGSHAIVRSDFEWFGPSLPHASILTVLEFMGMTKPWLRFFQSFLSAPVRFPNDREPRVRKRGTPIGYALSVVCGEAVLFMMDFAVNQRAGGLHLYRMHDDLWLWDSDVKKVADAWAEMKSYAKIVGLKFNESKTGSAYIGPPLSSSSDNANGETGPLGKLPPGDIRWGFLKFDPDQACFSIDQKEVDIHIAEMRRQLASTKSVFGWINAYNKYMAFIFRNFGGLPANCIETKHVIDMIATLSRIQRELFPADPSSSHGGGAVAYLRKTIEERFGMTGLPDGYFYFPVVAGGLELRNTMVELLALERNSKPLITPDGDSNGNKSGKKAKKLLSVPEGDTKEEYEEDEEDETLLIHNIENHGGDYFREERFIGEHKFTERSAYDRMVYKRLKKVWNLTADARHAKTPVAPGSEASDEFMSFDEYTSLRESHLRTWGKSYIHMLDTPEIHRVHSSSKIDALTKDSMERMHWKSLDTYEKWVVSMYGREFAERFGGLDAVDPTMIPTGMVKLFKTSRMKLDQ